MKREHSAISGSVEMRMHCTHSRYIDAQIQDTRCIVLKVQCTVLKIQCTVQSLAPLAPNWGKIISDRGGDNKLSGDKELNCQ